MVLCDKTQKVIEMIEQNPIRIYLDETQIAYLLSRKEFEDIRFDERLWQEEYSNDDKNPCSYNCALTITQYVCNEMLKVLQPTNVDFVDVIISQIRDKLQANVDMLYDIGMWKPDSSEVLEKELTEDDYEKNKDYIMKNLVYSGDTISFSKRLYNKWKVKFPENKLDVEEDAFQVLNDMYYDRDEKIALKSMDTLLKSSDLDEDAFSWDI